MVHYFSFQFHLIFFPIKLKENRAQINEVTWLSSNDYNHTAMLKSFLLRQSLETKKVIFWPLDIQMDFACVNLINHDNDKVQEATR